MPSLALPGGTSATLGRAIITALLSSPSTTKWNVIILSRSTKVPLWLQAIDPKSTRTTIKAVDYTSIPSLTSAFKDVDTVISVTSVVDGTRAQTETNLLHAAINAKCRRFAPSAWGIGPKCFENGLMKSLNEGVWEACLENSDKIETSRFNCGMFMNYIGHGIFVEKEEFDDETKLRAFEKGGGYADGADSAIQGLHPDGDLTGRSGAFLISLTNGNAELPVRDDGEWPLLVATTLRDVGRFVVASLDLLKWEKEMSLVGDALTMGELVKIAEEVTGKKFDVKKLTSGELKREGEALQPDQFMKLLWLEFKISYCKDEDGLTRLDPAVNRLCPDVKPVSFRKYIQTHWAGYQAEQKHT